MTATRTVVVTVAGVESGGKDKHVQSRSRLLTQEDEKCLLNAFLADGGEIWSCP